MEGGVYEGNGYLLSMACLFSILYIVFISLCTTENPTRQCCYVKSGVLRVAETFKVKLRKSGIQRAVPKASHTISNMNDYNA